MNILIIENKNEDIKQLKELLYIIQKRIMFSFNITSAKDLENIDLLEIYKYDLIFLGIELENINGIDLGRQIRKVNEKVKLIIVTHHQRYVLDGYKIKADRYFLKPLEQSFFEMEMKEVFVDLTNNLAGLYDPSLCEKKIYFKDILYIEFYLKHSKVYLYNGDILETKKSLKEWSATLNNYNFAYSHKSYILNFLHIKKICKKEITMKNNIILPLSRYYYKEFKRAYSLYLNR